jgi:hypothetical protein
LNGDKTNGEGNARWLKVENYLEKISRGVRTVRRASCLAGSTCPPSGQTPENLNGENKRTDILDRGEEVMPDASNLLCLLAGKRFFWYAS